MRLPDLSAARLLIVGDVMLDRYWFGDVARISPEAPVPVVKVGRSEERPGGAANVARNVAALGRRSLLSVVGDDEAGQSLQAAGGRAASMSACMSIRRSAPPSSCASLAGSSNCCASTSRRGRRTRSCAPNWSSFRPRLPDCDAVILSDYGKGGLTHIGEMIRLANAAGKQVLVDPKGDDFSKYAGATVVTPNRAELRAVVGRWHDEDELARKAAALREQSAAGGVAGDAQ
jgi:rfaE bifunctional protein kinase chain/domain